MNNILLDEIGVSVKDESPTRTRFGRIARLILRSMLFRPRERSDRWEMQTLCQ
jgi:hypothetical protein